MHPRIEHWHANGAPVWKKSVLPSLAELARLQVPLGWAHLQNNVVTVLEEALMHSYIGLVVDIRALVEVFPCFVAFTVCWL